MRTDTRKYFDFYDDDELVEIVQGLDRLAFKREWRVKVFHARVLLGFGLRLQESVDQVLWDCLPEYMWIPARKGRKQEWADPWPVFLPHYQEYILWARESEVSASAHLFTAQKQRWTRHLCVRMARYWWYSVIEEIGVRTLAPHAARRTHATWADEWFTPAADIRVVGSNLGHSDTKITADHYRRQIPGRRYSHPKPAWVEAAEQSAEALVEKMQSLSWCDAAAWENWKTHKKAFLRDMKQVDGRRNNAKTAVA